MHNYSRDEMHEIYERDEWTDVPEHHCSYGIYNSRCLIFKCAMAPYKFILVLDENTHELQVLGIKKMNYVTDDEKYVYVTFTVDVKLGCWQIIDEFICFTNINSHVMIRFACGSYDVTFKITRSENNMYMLPCNVNKTNEIMNVTEAKKQIMRCLNILTNNFDNDKDSYGYHLLLVQWIYFDHYDYERQQPTNQIVHDKPTTGLSPELSAEVNELFGDMSDEDAWHVIDEVNADFDIN